jgi:hypothetical protein
MITSGQTNKKSQLQRKLFTYMFIMWLLKDCILCCLLTLISCYYKQLLLFCKPSFSIPTTINLSISAIELNLIKTLSPSLLEIQCIIFIKWSFIFCLSSIYVICLSMYDWPATHYIFNLCSLNNMKICKIAISCFLKLFKKYRSFCIHWIYRSNTSTKTF